MAHKKRGRGKVGAGAGANQAIKQRLRTARTETNVEFNPSIRAARQEARGSAHREKDISGWYNQLAQEYGREAGAAQQAQATAEQATNSRLAENAQRGTTALNEQAEKDSSLAKLVGGPTDPQGMARAAQALASTQSQAATLAAPLTAQRANYTTYLAGRGASARLAAIGAHRDEFGRRRKIRSDISAARREKGQATVANFEKLTRADREAASEKAALGLKASQYGVTNRQAQARIGISRRNAATSERSQRQTAHHNKETENHNGLTPSERNTAQQKNKDAMASAKALLGTKVPKTPKEWAQFEEALIEKLGSSYSSEATRAVKKLRHRQRTRSEKQIPSLSPFG